MVNGQGVQGLRILAVVRDAPNSRSTVNLAASIIRSTAGRVTLIMIITGDQKQAQARVTLERYAAIIAPDPVEICVRAGHMPRRNRQRSFVR